MRCKIIRAANKKRKLILSFNLFRLLENNDCKVKFQFENSFSVLTASFL